MRKDFSYYADLDQFLGKDPAITQQVTLSSAVAETSSSSERQSIDSDSEPEESDSSKSKPVKRRKSQASEIVHF